MAIPQYSIDEWFAEEKSDASRESAKKSILTYAKRFAEAINETLPDGDEKINAINNIRQAVLACELSIRWKWPAGKISLM